MTEFERDSLVERGRVLDGKYKHYCHEWDGLTVDETCREFMACICFSDGDQEEIEALREPFYKELNEANRLRHGES